MKKQIIINNVKLNYTINNVLDLLIVQIGKTTFSISIPVIMNFTNSTTITEKVISKYLKNSIRIKKVLKAYIESLTNNLKGDLK